MGGHIHDLVAQRKELACRQHLREEIGIVRVCTDKGNTNEVILNAFAHKEVASLDSRVRHCLGASKLYFSRILLCLKRNLPRGKQDQGAIPGG